MNYFLGCISLWRRAVGGDALSFGTVGATVVYIGVHASVDDVCFRPSTMCLHVVRPCAHSSSNHLPARSPTMCRHIVELSDARRLIH